MTAHSIFTNRATDGLGSGLTSENTTESYVLTLRGYLDSAFCTILADIQGGTDYVRVGSLSNNKPTSLLMVPAGTKINCRLDGARGSTNITVLISGKSIQPSGREFSVEFSEEFD